MDGEKDYLISSGRRSPRGSNLVTRVWRHDCLPCLPARYVLAVMGFLGFINVYTLRVNLSVAIVRMVNETANASTNLVGDLKVHAHAHQCKRSLIEWTKYLLSFLS